MPNFLGPRQSIILVQLKGPKVEHTGVVAGMSGSPVYLEGKLAGALSLKLGVFTKEADPGVTPIEDVMNPPELLAAGRLRRSLRCRITLPHRSGCLLAPRWSRLPRRWFSQDFSPPRCNNSTANPGIRVRCRRRAELRLRARMTSIWLRAIWPGMVLVAVMR